MLAGGVSRKENFPYYEEVSKMPILKGYPTNSGYMGFVDGKYMLFATEGEYEEYVE